MSLRGGLKPDDTCTSTQVQVSNLLTELEIAHLHCNTPALAGGARERSAAQVSGKVRPRNDVKKD